MTRPSSSPYRVLIPEDAPLLEIAVECADAIRDEGVVLFARRRETCDLMVQAGEEIVMRGAISYQRVFESHLAPRMPLDLALALRRRARYLLWFDGATLVDPLTKRRPLVLSDSGEGTTR